MIYLADQWPEPYRGKLFTLNFHGRRVNVERLERSGSGYVGRHEPDMFFAADPWFRGIDLSYGPDGSVFVLDWSDTGECHERDGVHRSSGRIYRFTYGEPARVDVRDVSKLSERELVALHAHANEWFARQARRVLAERSNRGEPLGRGEGGPAHALRSRPRSVAEDPRLEFALCDRRDRRLVPARLLRHDHESVRAWAIRFLTDALPIDTIYSRRGGPDVALPADLRHEFAALARNDPSALVRLVLASTLQRLPVGQRVELAEALVSRSEDNADHNIPSLIWTGLIPVAESDPDALVRLALGLPIAGRAPADRAAAGRGHRDPPGPLNALLERAASRPEEFQAQVVAGLADALTGWRKAAKPAAWDRLSAELAASSDPALRARVRDLNVLFGDGRALEEVKRLALDESRIARGAEGALADADREPAARPRSICERLMRVRFLNVVAVRGLALYDDPAIGKTLAASYRAFHPSERSGLARDPGLAPGVCPGPARPDRRRQDSASGPERLPCPADPQPGRSERSPSGSHRSGACSATRTPTGASGSSRSRSSSTRPRWPAPTSAVAGPSLIASAPRATSCMDPAARSGPISPAPAAITSTICSKT